MDEAKTDTRKVSFKPKPEKWYPIQGIWTTENQARQNANV